MTDIKELLREIRDKRGELIHIRLHKEDVRLSLLPGAIRYDKDRVDFSPDDPMIKMIERLEKIEAKETKCEEELLKDIEFVNDIIMSMPTSVCKRLLWLRYIDGSRPMQWKDIADELGYSEDHTRGKLHGKAIAEARAVAEKITHAKT